MKTLLKKVVAIASIAALVTINSAYAAGLSLTGSTGTDLSLTGSVATISGSTATGSLAVTVNATVLPTLTFEISSDTLNLGNLVIGDYARTDLTYTGVTNALGGMSVFVQSNLLNDGNGKEIWASSVTNLNTDYKFVRNSTVSDGVGTSFDKSNQEVQTITSNGSVDGVLNIGAKIQADTIAGNYSDVLTFTVTGTF